MITQTAEMALLHTCLVYVWRSEGEWLLREVQSLLRVIKSLMNWYRDEHLGKNLNLRNHNAPTIARSSISLKDCEDLDNCTPAVACMKLRADKSWGMFIFLQNYDPKSKVAQQCKPGLCPHGPVEEEIQILKIILWPLLWKIPLHCVRITMVGLIKS